MQRTFICRPEITTATAFGDQPDEPDFNEETRQASEEVDAGIGVKRYAAAAQMFADWGVWPMARKRKPAPSPEPEKPPPPYAS